MNRRSTILFSLLAALCVVLFVVDLAVGSVAIPPSKVVAALFGGGSEVMQTIVFDIRFVRAVVAVLAGMALSISGLQMQVLFRNPLAGPYVLGVSAGASLGVALFTLALPMLSGVSGTMFMRLGITGVAWIGSAAIFISVRVAFPIRFSRTDL